MRRAKRAVLDAATLAMAIALALACGEGAQAPGAGSASEAPATAQADKVAAAADSTESARVETRTPRQRPLAEVWNDLLDARNTAYEVQKRPDPFEPEIQAMTMAVRETLFLLQELRLAADAVAPDQYAKIAVNRLIDQYTRRVMALGEAADARKPGMWGPWLDRADAPLLMLQFEIAPDLGADHRDLRGEPDLRENLRTRHPPEAPAS